jgi:hypothetical protein
VGQTASWLNINPTQQISSGNSITVHQEASIGGHNEVGPSQTLPNIPQFIHQKGPLGPGTFKGLVECSTTLEILGVTPGAVTVIANEGQNETWINPTQHLMGKGGLPLKAGMITAQQSMPRCKQDGTLWTDTVPKVGDLPPPTITHDLCSDVLRLTASTVHVGGTFIVAREVHPASGPITSSVIGNRPILYDPEIIDLPQSIKLSDPAGQVYISVSQSSCGVTSKPTLVKLASGGPFGPPGVRGTLYECARSIPITNAHPGSNILTFDDTGALADLKGVEVPNFTIRTWRGLQPGQLTIQQFGCKADAKVSMPVNKLPDFLPMPVIPTKLRPNTSWVPVQDIIQGAQVYLLIDRQLGSGSTEILDKTGYVLANNPLSEGENVIPVQIICSKTSPDTGKNSVTVTAGKMILSGIPAQVSRGTTVSFTVTATDADNHTPVTATVFLNSQPPVSVSTGQPITYSPRAGDPSPTITVSSPPAYVNATATINLVDPITTWTLTGRAQPNPPLLAGQLPVQVASLNWNVVPDWDASKTRNLTVTSIGSVLSASGTFPIPTGAVKSLNVTISGTASVQAGYVNGVYVQPGSVPFNSASQRIGFHGPVNELMSWHLEVEFVYDPGADTGSQWIAPTFLGLQP